jgi:penicillin-binding protein 2
MKNLKRRIGVKLGEDDSKRENIFKIFITLIFLLLILRMVQLQVFNQDKYVNLAEKNRFKVKTIPAPRGKIYDRYGRLVVTNGAGYRLVYLNERDMDPEKIKVISELTGYDNEYIEKRIKYGEIFPYTRENVILENLEEEKAHKLIERIVDYPYLQVQTYYRRRYLYDSVASHSIGYIKKISEDEYKKLKDYGYSQRDIIGKDGLEKFYDEKLKGKDGYEYIEVNAFSRIQTKGNEKKEPIPGNDLYITLDMELQTFMEEQFEKDGRYGAFIAIDPKNGEIITMVSYPTYSLNMFSSQISQEDWEKIVADPKKPLSNKAIAGEYPPGSIFKVISAMAFLKTGINPNEKFLDKNGVYSIGKWKYRAWKAGGHGYVDMKKSLVESANPYYYKLSHQIGYKPLLEAAKDFGLDIKTDIDIPGEKKGLMPTEDWKKKMNRTSWTPGDTVISAIGKGFVTVTHIQMAMVYTKIATGGEYYPPHLGLKLIPFNENREDIIRENKIILDETKYSKKYYKIIDEALIAAVEQNNGTTRILRTPKMKVAAKSGSAQNPHSKLTHAWAAGYFPADNPEIVFLCLLEGAGSGGHMAGGMTKLFIDKYLASKYLREHPEETPEKDIAKN